MKNTLNAIQRRLDNGETRFFLGRYYYEADINGIIRRREQEAGRTPTSDWERVCSWNPQTWKVEAENV